MIATGKVVSSFIILQQHHFAVEHCAMLSAAIYIIHLFFYKLIFVENCYLKITFYKLISLENHYYLL